MKRIAYVVVEALLRAFTLYFSIFIFGAIFTMVLYKDDVLVTFTLLAFVFCFIFKYIADRLRTPEMPKAKNGNIILSVAFALVSLGIFLHIYRLYWMYPVMYSGHEMEITTVFELKRNAYMLLRALPSYMHAQLAYVAGTSEATFNLDVYNSFSVLNHDLYCEMFVLGLIKTVARASGTKLFRRRKVNETDRTSRA